jgi:hypothetical protein
MLFLNAIPEYEGALPEPIRAASISAKMEKYYKLMGVNPTTHMKIMLNQSDPRFVQLFNRFNLFGDFDTY